MGKKRPYFKRHWLHDEIRLLGFRIDIYNGRNGTLPGFELSRPKRDIGFTRQWDVLTVTLRPFSWKVRKDGHHYTSKGE